MRFGRFTGAIGIAILVVAMAIVYGRGLDNHFAYDDYWLIESNPALHQPESLARFLSTPLFAGTRESDDVIWANVGIEYWRPFVKLALLAQYRAFGTRAAGYHAVSLAVHLVSTCLLFLWLSRRLAAPPRVEPTRLSGVAIDPRRTLAAVLGAAIFALHPARVETVTWVSGCMDLWMVFWVLVGLVAWDRRGRGATIAATLAFVLAVWSKEAAVVVPACLALDAWARGRFDAATRRRLLAPAAGVVVALATWVVLVPPSGSAIVFGGVPRILASAALYAGRILWPIHPTTQVGLIGPEGVFEFGIGLLTAGAAVVFAIAAFAAVAWRRPRVRVWSGDVGWIVLPLLPVANFLAIGYASLVAERFLALPLVGVAALCARALVAVPRAVAPAVAAAEAAAAIGGGVIAAAYVPQFRDSATLWQYETRIHPTSPNMFLFLARAEMGAGRLQASERAALAAHAAARTPDMAAWSALAWAAARLQSVTDADQESLVRLRTFYDELIGTGQATFDAGGVALRAAPTRTGIELIRQSAAVRNARILAHARTTSFTTAESLLVDLLRDKPTPGAAANWVRVLGLQLRFADALAALQTALGAYPGDATLVALGSQLRHAEAWVGGADTDPLRRDTARALLWLYFGSIPLAQASLSAAQASYPDAVETAVLTQLVAAASGRIHEAREYLLNQRTADPANIPAYEWGLGQIPLLTTPPPAVVPGNVDALMR
jgi:hypothetical protein